MSRTDRPRGILRTLVFAVLPTALALAVAEAGLRLTGSEEASSRALHAHGFDSDAAYFALDPERPGGVLTQMFGGGNAEKRIPPKGAAERVFLFGGSNTQGFSTVRLQGFLEEALPGRSFEVVNLGREGYGSGRVSILLEQSLAFEPDLCILYSGHNEFVEDGYKQELDAAEAEWGGRLRAGLGHLATYRWLEARLDSRASSATDAGKSDERPPPEDFDAEYAKFADQTYPELLDRMAVYGENLRSMARSCERAGVPLLMSTIVTNHFSPPYASTPGPDRDPAQVQSLERRLLEIRSTLPEHLRTLDMLAPSERLQGRDWKRRSNPEARAEPPPPLRELAEPMGQYDFRPDPAGWTEQVWRVISAFGRFATEPVTAQERTALERARTELTAVLAAWPDHPRALFLGGLVAHRLGDLPAAGRALRDAQRFDRAPRKASDLTNDWIRRVAAEYEEVHLHDADEAWRPFQPGGVFGYELLGDNCHLHPAASQYLMRDFAHAIVELGL